METSVASSSAYAGPSSDPTDTYEDDSRHFAVAASHIAFPTPNMAPPPPDAPPPLRLSDAFPKGSKEAATLPLREASWTDPSIILADANSVTKPAATPANRGKLPVSLPPERKTPLNLLDLPIDILKDIIREVTHTNDLASLALCHSALHNLAIPHIYSRFDIVWPDSSTHAEPRSGVDALTYGLATLVMAEEVFGEAPGQRRQAGSAGKGRASDLAVRRRRGNHYAQFTKKFSLGNGPADWVQEYLITKEGGKMLGTLVALAVARMRSLETFVWDMPTGILRDVWAALSSLGDRDDGLECRLEKVAVRWHDNTVDHPAVPPVPTNVGLSVLTPGALASHPAALDRVEHPSFSVLPALKSLSVLDVDELAYLDEMAVLIGKSVEKLRELRVGIARHAMSRDWVTVWEGGDAQQVDHEYPTAGSLTIGEKRLGGVLGTLTGFVNDMRKPKMTLPLRSKRVRRSATHYPLAYIPSSSPPVAATSSPALLESQEPLIDLSAESPPDERPALVVQDGVPPLEGLLETPTDPLISNGQASPLHDPTSSVFSPEPRSPETYTHPIDLDPPHAHLNHKLKLETLELERVPLCVPVLLNALDWTTLTSLTLLHCPNHEQLWKTLRRQFAPIPKSPLYPHPRRPSHSSPRKPSTRHPASNPSQDPSHTYPLRLQKLHTNAATPALLAFLRETLKPHTLQTLFLQDPPRSPASTSASASSTPVSIEAIYRGPLRRHRLSLQRLLLDSSSPAEPAQPRWWRRWQLPRPVLANLTCAGKFPQLRELGVCLDYRDWHFFLQSLPNVPTLRSLYLPHLADCVVERGAAASGEGGAGLVARELALQVVDIVSLRREVQVCYLGVGGKCFEVLEPSRVGAGGKGLGAGGRAGGRDGRAGGSGYGYGGGEEEEDEEDMGDMEEDEATDSEVGLDDDDDDDDDDEDNDDDEEEDDDEDAGTSEDDYSDGSLGSLGSDDGSSGPYGSRLRLREILFYDDKVAVFKARHGRL